MGCFPKFSLSTLFEEIKTSPSLCWTLNARTRNYAVLAEASRVEVSGCSWTSVSSLVGLSQWPWSNLMQSLQTSGWMLLCTATTRWENIASCLSFSQRRWLCSPTVKSAIVVVLGWRRKREALSTFSTVRWRNTLHLYIKVYKMWWVSMLCTYM